MADQSWRTRPTRMASETVARVAARISEHARAHSLTSVRLVLHGGEPLLAGPALIREIVTKIRSALEPDAQASVGMQTNGVLLDAGYLKLLDELDVTVGVSLDGDVEAHDRYRRRANGKGSHTAVVRGLQELTDGPFQHLFSGLLATIDPRNSPVGTYEALIAFAPPAVDFLLPHGNWSSPPPGRVPNSTETPYADWLIAVFDRWYGAPVQETNVRLFSEIMNLLLGRPSGSEEIGLSPLAVAVVETDGSIEQADSLKSAYDGAPATGLHVSRDSFDAALRLPSVMARQFGIHALSERCRECPIHQVCGGGLYAHRYHEGNGFDNPSVYCPDLTKLIYHIRNVLRADVASLSRSSRP